MTANSSFPTELDELAFLLEEVPRALLRRFEARTQAIGLSRTQWRLLAYLLREEGITQTELARRLDLERVTIGLTLDKMEAKGLVERRRSPGDRRSWRVHAKPEARKLLPQLRKEADAAYAEMLAGIAAEDLAAFRSILEAMAANLRK